MHVSVDRRLDCRLITRQIGDRVEGWAEKRSGFVRADYVLQNEIANLQCSDGLTCRAASVLSFTLAFAVVQK